MRLSTSDWVLIAYIFLLVPLMLVGFGFARRKLFVPHHKLTMTTIMIVNWVLILSVMFVTYDKAVAPGVPQDLKLSAIFIPTLHGLFGITAQVLATYLVIRMWFEKQLPEWFKVKNIKRYMRTTLGLWLLTALFGLTTWAVFNRDFLSSKAAVEPARTQEAAPAQTKEATAAAPIKTKEATPASTKEATAAVASTKDVTPAATQAASPITTAEATPAATKDATPAMTKDAAPVATQEASPVATKDAVPAATKAK